MTSSRPSEPVFSTAAGGSAARSGIGAASTLNTTAAPSDRSAKPSLRPGVSNKRLHGDVSMKVPLCNEIRVDEKLEMRDQIAGQLTLATPPDEPARADCKLHPLSTLKCPPSHSTNE